MSERASSINISFSQFEEQSQYRIPLPSFMRQVNPDFVLIRNEILEGSLHHEAFRARSIFEQNLEHEGLILESQVVESEPHLTVLKIWAPLEVLKRYSELLKIRLPMILLPGEAYINQLNGNSSSDHSDIILKETKPNSTRNNKRRWLTKFIKRFRFNFELDPELFPEKSKGLTGVYSRDKEYLFDVHESNMYEIFPVSMRSRIVQYILKRTPYKGGDDLRRDDFAFGFERLIQKKFYEAGYALHDGKITTKGSVRERLYNNWGKFSKCFKFQPLDALRDYFGVNIAIYYAWVGYYTGMLVFASFFGLLCFIYGMSSISKDQFVKDVCNKQLDFVMCPLCNRGCPYWYLSERCAYSTITHLFDNDFTVPFALLMSIWSACFLEFWKRYLAKITYRWDLTNSDIRDFTPRPEYVAKLKQIYPMRTSMGNINREEAHRDKYDFDLSIPFWKKELPFRLLSYSTVFLLVVLALSALTGVIMYRLWFLYWLTKGGKVIGGETALERVAVSVTAAILNLIFIVIFEKVYERIAVRLTEVELPRTQPEFDASYTLKVYLLQFINNYSSIFYVAFFKGINVGHPVKYNKLFGLLRQEECGISCMPELSIQLIVIMVGKQSQSIFSEIILPWCKRGVKRVTGRLKVYIAYKSENLQQTRRTSLRSTTIPQWLEDYDLLDCGPFLITDQYLQMVLQLGFVTIFVTAFPLAPIFAIINNIMELRGNAGKMLRHYRRPVGIRVRDIGVWSDIIDGVVKVAILSNACIIAVTSNFIPKLMHRYFLFESSHPNYGTLNGYLIHTLTAYDTRHIESPPSRSLIGNQLINEPVCHFPTYRYDHTADPKFRYNYTPDHWKIWLARVFFIIVYENVVTILLLLLKWIIPDMPSNLRKQIDREERMINNLILRHEQWQSRRSRRRHRKTTSDIYFVRSAEKIQQEQPLLDNHDEFNVSKPVENEN